MSPTRTQIAITGAAGVVGLALLRELADQDCVCMVNQSQLPAAPHRTVLRCDVAEARVGLDRSAYRKLARDIDAVVHCAAVTDWTQPDERFRTVNVRGTQNVLDLARAADAPLYHVSTSFTRAIAADAPLRLEPSHLIVNYVRSKRDSDALVADSGHPHTVLRPTNLIGDSASGEIARNQMVQLVAEFVCRGKAPLVPTRPRTLVDVITQDLVAKVIAEVVGARDVGREYWLTYGAEAMTVDEAVAACVAFMDSIGHPIEAPRLIDRDRLDDFADEVARLPGMARAFFPRLVELCDGMTACGVFPTSLPQLYDRYDLPSIDVRAAYVRGLEYWAASRGLWPGDVRRTGNGRAATA